MIYEFAPLEGITDAVYRRCHARFYPGIARYYTPFVSPTQNHRFTPREKRELSPENNPGITLIPQLLGKNAADFIWAAETLADMGYGEVNLNLGCPSRTVTAKGKGAGLLSRPEELDRFLDAIFAASPIEISIKTRLGMESPEEFGPILAIYERYPLRRLIIHPRTARQLYSGDLHMDRFARALAYTSHPVVYNGDLFTSGRCRRFFEAYPQVDTVMLGRGLVADPGMLRKLEGQPPDKLRLKRFHDALCAEYPVVFGDRSSAAHRMKAIWAYLLFSFRDGERFRKSLIKARRWEDFIAVTEEVFQKLELLDEAVFRPL